MNKILFDKMAEIVEKRVKNYKTDFYDNDVAVIENYEYDEFLWIIRSSGTHFLNINHLKYKNSRSYNDLIYFKDNKNVNLYKINTKSLTVKKVKYSNIVDEVENELKNPESIDLLINKEIYNISFEEFNRYGFIYNLVEKYKLNENISIDKIIYNF